MTESLGDAVRSRWDSLLSSGLRVTQEEPGRVVLASGRVTLIVAASPRGEVEVTVTPIGSEWPRQWSWSGMVGRADVGRLLELALGSMQADPQVLAGSDDFYDRVSDVNGAQSQALNDRAAGKPSAPEPKRLP